MWANGLKSICGGLLFFALLFSSVPAFSQVLSSKDQETIKILAMQEISLNQALKHISELKNQKANLEQELNQTKESDKQRYNELLMKLADMESELTKWKQISEDLSTSIKKLKESLNAEFAKGIAIGFGCGVVTVIIIDLIRGSFK
jgi:predicted  nucleic acid-binding Zn-ribbon protein